MDFVTLLFYSLEQANKDIFAAVHQRKAELAEIVDWTGLYETGCFYLFRVPFLLMDKVSSKKYLSFVAVDIMAI